MNTKRLRPHGYKYGGRPRENMGQEYKVSDDRYGVEPSVPMANYRWAL